jgi:dynein heavy chain
MLDGSTEAFLAPRVHLLFLAEDPQKFRDRIVAAHSLRADTESQLMYNLTVDCMPDHNVQPINPSVLRGLALGALKKTGLEIDDPAVKQLLNEVGLSHTRSLNKLALDSAVKADPAQFPGVVVPAPPVPVGRRDWREDTVEIDFELKVYELKTKVLQNHVNVLSAIDLVRHACAPVETGTLSLSSRPSWSSTSRSKTSP